jgi:hypothetical protein
MRLAGIKKYPLGRRRFTSVYVGNDANVTDPFERDYSRHENLLPNIGWSGGGFRDFVLLRPDSAAP